MSDSNDSCCDERKIPEIHSESDAYQKAGPVHCEVLTFSQENDAVMMPVMTAAYSIVIFVVSNRFSIL